MRGFTVESATLKYTGLEYDRHWMIIKPNGGYITQRQFPQMILIKTQLNEHSLVLSKMGMTDLEVPLINTSEQTLAATIWQNACQVVDEGPIASQWLTQAIGTPKPVRLVRMANNFQRYQSHPHLQGNNTHTLFADAAPYLVCNQQSLLTLNQALKNAELDQVSMERFRPNIVIKGLKAFQEHQFKCLQSDHYQLNLLYPCQRCVIPNIDIATGIRHPQQQPFRLLSTMNTMPDNTKIPAFGENAALSHGDGQKISVGDTLNKKDLNQEKYETIN